MFKQVPYKSTAMGLILCLFLGPIGLLYATLIGGIVMLGVGLIILTAKSIAAGAVLWLVCCVWSVSATDAYNKKIWLQIKPETR